MLQFLTWVSTHPRTYAETIDVWRSNCPRMTIWEDALSDGLIRIENDGPISQSRIVLTDRGMAML